MKPTILLSYAIIIITTIGCIPQKQTVLLQDLEKRNRNYSNPFDSLTTITDKYYLQTNDYLYINISTADPKLSEFFNTRGSSSMSGGGQSNTRFLYYMIDDQMNIDFPFAGKINLAGCNIPMAKEKIKTALLPFLKEANIVVKLANAQFTALGEVRSQGIINMQKDQITIFEAIAQVGGITPYGKTKKIKLLRQTQSGEKTYVFDLTDKNIVNSDYYYVYPNDLIYIRPMKAKNWGVGESFSLGVISGLLAFTLTIISLTK
ncbi:MAG: polysaccharide biosynthesis/export family protein [Marinilabiliaceae bacterium]|nr:polysaccharide biosynthesis/export family protein [Marinilabiliaceae bacterium]